MATVVTVIVFLTSGAVSDNAPLLVVWSGAGLLVEFFFFSVFGCFSVH